MSRKEGGSNPQAGSGGWGQPAYHPRTPLKSNMTLTPLLRPSVAPGQVQTPGLGTMALKPPWVSALEPQRTKSTVLCRGRLTPWNAVSPRMSPAGSRSQARNKADGCQGPLHTPKLQISHLHWT